MTREQDRILLAGSHRTSDNVSGFMPAKHKRANVYVNQLRYRIGDKDFVSAQFFRLEEDDGGN